ncbi:DNA alkylation repair protein [uncultured Aquitalea sp.]|uniref:DNA alkylation repair protein n=1 Tax=uncultured Aquitalea sp. TaxID=540272 RepID=UPI0025EE02E1|nr:DNA alkylation repair protein [uncultured Aquitalea sp.]
MTLPTIAQQQAAERFAEAVAARLQPLADPTRAVGMSAYLLDQFTFLGLPAPLRRAAVRELIGAQPADAAQLLAMAEALWRLPQREYRYIAVDLLRRHAALLDVAALPALQTLLLDQPWWETVDGLAAVASAVLRKAQSGAVEREMDGWLQHDSFWVRRLAMLHQLGWRQDTNAERLQRYALHLCAEKEFFIRKAIGWALRDYARSQPDWVAAFLAKHRQQLSPLTAREAGKHL